jgi:hypothetical protein
MRNIFTASLLLFLSISAIALPQCDQEPFDNCIATAASADGSKYVGEWMDGKPHGQGTFTSADGGKYAGEWKNLKRHGQGTFTWADGRKYVGAWKDGKRHGQGTFTSPDGSEYAGEWRNNELHGRGTSHLPDGALYIGDFLEGKKHGKGKYFWLDGSRYEGKFSNGLSHGEGKETLRDGTSYVGSFRSGIRHGLGKEFSSDGQLIREGNWEEDLYVPDKKSPEVEPSETALAWQRKNPWFKSDSYKLESEYTLGLHHQLLAQGVPVDSDLYYERLDAGIQANFPNLLKAKKSNEGGTKKRDRGPASGGEPVSQAQVAKYQSWLVNNPDKYGTEDYNIVWTAYSNSFKQAAPSAPVQPEPQVRIDTYADYMERIRESERNRVAPPTPPPQKESNWTAVWDVFQKILLAIIAGVLLAFPVHMVLHSFLPNDGMTLIVLAIILSIFMFFSIGSGSRSGSGVECFPVGRFGEEQCY